MTTVTIGDLVLGDGRSDEGGAPGWYFTDLVGWYDIADSKSDVRERPVAHGAFGIAADWRSSLAISVGGVFRGSTHDEAVAAQTQLGAVLGRNKPTPVLVDDGGVTTSRMVSVRHAPIGDTHGGPAVTFSAELLATDPRRYGETITQIADVPVSGGGLVWPLGTNPSRYWDFGADGSSGRISITNIGTVETFPSLQVSGGLGGGFIVTDITDAKSVRFDRVIPIGSFVTINQRTGRASIDGQSDVSGFITTRDFFSIGPGESHVIQFSPIGTVTGTPQLTARTAPAY